MKRYILLGLSCLIMAFSVGCGTSDNQKGETSISDIVDSLTQATTEEETTSSKTTLLVVDGTDITGGYFSINYGITNNGKTRVSLTAIADSDERGTALAITSYYFLNSMYEKGSFDEYDMSIASTKGYYEIEQTADGVTQKGTGKEGATSGVPDWIKNQDSNAVMETYTSNGYVEEVTNAFGSFVTKVQELSQKLSDK